MTRQTSVQAEKGKKELPSMRSERANSAVVSYEDPEIELKKLLKAGNPDRLVALPARKMVDLLHHYIFAVNMTGYGKTSRKRVREGWKVVSTTVKIRGRGNCIMYDLAYTPEVIRRLGIREIDKEIQEMEDAFHNAKPIERTIESMRSSSGAEARYGSVE